MKILKMKFMNDLKKISNIHIPIKYIVSFLIILLIIFYYCKEQVLFEDLLKILVPFLIGTSVKITQFICKSYFV